jgi:hypothetical protein
MVVLSNDKWSSFEAMLPRSVNAPKFGFPSDVPSHSPNSACMTVFSSDVQFESWIASGDARDALHTWTTEELSE